MKLNLLLWMLSVLMKRASKTNETFKKIAGNREVVFQLTTADHKITRHYRVNHGRVTTGATPHPHPDMIITFKNADYAFRALTAKDKDAIRKGILDEDITITGDFSYLILFQSLVQTFTNKPKAVPRDIAEVGFIGAGLMGAPMIRTLLRNGFAVRVIDLNAQAVKNVVEAGAVECADMKHLCDVEVVFVMVNTMQQVKDVVSGLSNALPDDKPLTVVIMSTVLPDAVIELRDDLAARAGRTNFTLLDAPVSGAPLNAEAGKLAIMVGGDRAGFEKVKPLLDVMGEHVFCTGPLGSGSAMKLVNNIVAISVGLNLSEALCLGARKGLKTSDMIRVLNASSGKNFLSENWPFTKMMFQMILNDTTYDAKAALFSTGIKDLSTAVQWAEKDNLTILSAENAINQINRMTKDEFVSTLKSILQN